MKMAAWQIEQTGSIAEALTCRKVELPQMAGDDLLIRTLSCGINFADLLMCQGLYQKRPDLPFTPGLEACGIVETAPAPYASLIGCRVAGPTTLPAGGLAGYCLLDARDIHLVPEEMTDVGAAMLTISYETAWFALHARAAVRAGDYVLIDAAAGAMGSAAIQLAVAADARVIAIASGEAKRQQCLADGAQIAFDSHTLALREGIRDATQGRGVDVVIESVGGALFDICVRSVAPGARFVVVGFSSGDIPSVAVNRLLLKNCLMAGMQIDWARRNEPDTLRRCRDELARLFSQGAIKPRIWRTFDFDQAPEAIRSIERRQAMGKVVVLGPKGAHHPAIV